MDDPSSTPFPPAAPPEEHYASVATLWSGIAVGVMWLVWWYADRKTPWFVYCSTWLGWIMPFTVVFLLPLDMTSTRYTACLSGTAEGALHCDSPFLYVSPGFLQTTWRVIYWTMFGLTFLVIPMVQSYCDSGYFTRWERVKKAVRANLIYYGILVAVGLLGLAVLGIGGGFKDPNALRGTVMALANLWGLSLVTVLMSYGLIEVPRHLWHLANRNRALRYLEFTAPSVKDSLGDAQTAFDELAAEVHAISSQVHFHDDMRVMVDQMLEKCPLPSDDEPSAESRRRPGGGAGNDRPRATSGTGAVDMAKLAQLHKELIRAERVLKRYKYEWKSLCEHAFFLQDAISSRNSATMKFSSSLRPVPAGRLRELRLIAEWLWHIKLWPVAMRVLAVCCGVMSAVVVWSETTFVVTNPIISLFGVIFSSVTISNASVELLSLLSMTFMCSCAMFALFKVRVFDKYSIHRGHSTSDISLCWFTSYMCKLAFPLCYNFITMAADDDTAFSRFMGAMNFAPLFGTFQFYVPLLVIVIVVLLAGDVVGRAMRMCGYPAALFSNDIDGDDAARGDVEDGKILLADARYALERAAGGGGSSFGLATDDALTGLMAETAGGARPLVSTRSTASAPSRTKATKAPGKYASSNPLYAKYAEKLRGAASIDADEDTTRGGNSGVNDGHSAASDPRRSGMFQGIWSTPGGNK